MSNSLHDIEGLVRKGQVLTALATLESVKSANSKVWGLDDQIRQVRAVIDRANGLTTKAQKRIAENRCSEAYPLLKQAIALVADDPELNDQRMSLKRRIARSLADAADATRLLGDGRTAEALEAAESALSADFTQKNLRLRDEIRAANDRSQREVRKSRFGYTAIALVCIVWVVVMILGLWWLRDAQARERNERAQIAESLRLVGVAQAEIEQEQYAAAKAHFEQSIASLEGIAGQQVDDLRHGAYEALASDAIVQGVGGKVPLDGEWLAPEERDRRVHERKLLAADVQSLATLLDDYLAGRIEGVAPPEREHRAAFEPLKTLIGDLKQNVVRKNFDEVRAGQARAIEMCEDLFRSSGLVKYEGRWMTAAAAEEAEMTAKGLVKYEGEWITAKEKERRVMVAQGMLLYKDQWVTPGRKEEMEMEERGLVKYGDRWVTKDEKLRLEMTAKGLVEYEGRWVSTQERDQLIDEKKQRLARAAFEMSKQLVKEILKAPASAEFPDYSDPRVIVRIKDDGHFVVGAYVDAQNSFGAMLRNTYYVELWPLDADGKRWQNKTPVLISP